MCDNNIYEYYVSDEGLLDTYHIYVTSDAVIPDYDLIDKCYLGGYTGAKIIRNINTSGDNVNCEDKVCS